jgi:Selenoprotein, putative
MTRAGARKLAAAAARVWSWLRAVSGDDAYEAYVSRAGRRGATPTREEFYVDGLRRKYSRLSRCC